MDELPVPVAEATDRQLLVELVRRQARLETTLMAALEDAVTRISSEVGETVGLVDDLRAQLADARATADRLAADDATDKAEIAVLQGQLGAAQESADSAASALHGAADALDAAQQPGGTEPEPEPEPGPGEPEPEPAPEPEPSPPVNP